MKRLRFEIYGIVQGVGFRPFVYNIATNLNLKGFVSNTPSGVFIEVQGDEKTLKLFEHQIYKNPPAHAFITQIKKKNLMVKNEKVFSIKDSKPYGLTTAYISPDIATCDQCKIDIKKNNHFKNYFATNCTQCGPRYTIIKKLPYDRNNTAMNSFHMCKRCEGEYINPKSRRYHAQPIACQECGPQLGLYDKNGKKIISDNPIKTIAKKIQNGSLVAIKGIGGFHLMCNSMNNTTIQKLRTYKNRPTKPFALMCKDMDQIASFGSFTQKEQELITSKEAPIVLIKKKPHFSLDQSIAPNIDRIGVMLGYTPLHTILFEYFDNPIVATSANLKDEPIIGDMNNLLKKLPFVDFILDFNRDIINPIDDSVVQVINNQIQILRLGRGYAPKTIPLRHKINNKLLALGGNQKSAIAIAFENNIILSPHIGDLKSDKSFDYFLQTIKKFEKFYQFQPDKVLFDFHPNYYSSKWAKQLQIENPKLNIQKIQHHLAHIYSVMAEHNLDGEYIGFSFDGLGAGENNELWGGEVFLNDKRKYHFKPIKLLGGEIAIKEPRRVALAMLFDRYNLDTILKLNIPSLTSFSTKEIKLLYHLYTTNTNTPKTSSVGRLFDGVVSLAGVLHYQNYEGEAGLLSEIYYDQTIKEDFKYRINKGVIEIDFNFFDKNIISKFINTLIKIMIDIAKLEQKKVIFSGGVFQNKIVTTKLIQALEKEAIKYYYNKKIPCNDGGLSIGQLYYGILHC